MKTPRITAQHKQPFGCAYTESRGVAPCGRLRAEPSHNSTHHKQPIGCVINAEGVPLASASNRTNPKQNKKDAEGVFFVRFVCFLGLFRFNCTNGAFAFARTAINANFVVDGVNTLRFVQNDCFYRAAGRASAARYAFFTDKMCHFFLPPIFIF